MPLSPWTSIKPGQDIQTKGTKDEGTKDKGTKGTKDADTRDIKNMSLLWKNEKDHKITDLLTGPLLPDQGGHVSNVDKWATL